jgi:hypothetical protein
MLLLVLLGLTRNSDEVHIEFSLAEDSIEAIRRVPFLNFMPQFKVE